MSTRVIKTESDIDLLSVFLKTKKLPVTVKITAGAPRSLAQNRLQHKWFRELEEQGDQRAKDYRAYCKLNFGVPILRSADDDFREKYDLVIMPCPYPAKLAMMVEPFDFPVTRLLSVKQTIQYLDDIYGHYTKHGFQLTAPEERPA